MNEHFKSLLGQAVAGAWGELPRDVQELLFERAVSAGQGTRQDGQLREELALYLHDKHPRTHD